jgi:hypothetical protein
MVNRLDVPNVTSEYDPRVNGINIVIAEQS